MKTRSLGIGILSRDKKRRHKASLGQKICILSLNNNTIFSVTKNDNNSKQLKEGDCIVKNDIIKITYTQDNDPIVLEVEDKRIIIYIYSSVTIKIIGIGKNVPKISINLEEGNFITKYKNKSYDFEITNNNYVVPVLISIKYKGIDEKTTLYYSDINNTKNNLLNSKFVDNTQIDHILIPYNSITDDLMSYFLNEILYFFVQNKIYNIPIFLNTSKPVKYTIYRFHFETIYKLFIENFEKNEINSSNYLLQLSGGFDKLIDLSEGGIILWISSWLDEFNTGKFKQYYEKKIEKSNINNFIHYIIAHRIASGFLQINKTDEPRYIEKLYVIKNKESTQGDIYKLIQETFKQYNFFNNNKTMY